VNVLSLYQTGVSRDTEKYLLVPTYEHTKFLPVVCAPYTIASAVKSYFYIYLQPTSLASGNLNTQAQNHTAFIRYIHTYIRDWTRQGKTRRRVESYSIN
jgi:hypothetical protein